MNFIEFFKPPGAARPLISFVGGGGKTSAIYKLASELKRSGARVLLTTTTAIYAPEKPFRDDMYLQDSLCGLAGVVPALSPAPGTITVIGRRVTAAGKLQGLDAEWIDQLYGRRIFDWILVEADGAKGRPVKAPEQHEPVIPQAATAVVGLIGADCLGEPVDARKVHRPHIFAEITGKAPGGVIDEEALVRLVLSPAGLFKACPASAAKILLINKAESAGQIAAARRVCGLVLQQDAGVSKALAGSLQKDSIQLIPVPGAYGKVFPYACRQERGGMTAVILAAGFSRRFGGQKLLAPIDGKPMLLHVIEAVESAGFDEVVLVCRDDEVKSLARNKDIRIAHNARAAEGISSSILCGLRHAKPAGAYMFFMGDQPFIDAGLIRRLRKAFEAGGGAIVAPRYGGRRGNPVIFAARWKEQLEALTGDVGGKSVMDAHPDEVCYVDIADDRAGADIDAREDYREW
jgi:molybdenum cofactor cytidylyltransferase